MASTQQSPNKRKADALPSNDEPNRKAKRPKRQMMDDMWNRDDFQASDMKKKFELLGTNISRFVLSYLPETASESLSGAFTHITPDAEDYLGDEDNCPWLFRAWIWRFLEERIFNEDSLFWGGSAGRDSMQYWRWYDNSHTFADASQAADFHQLRLGQTRRFKSDSDVRLAREKELREEMFDFFFSPSALGLTPSKRQNEMEEEAVARARLSIRSVITEAARLDLMTRQSNALWSFIFPPLNFSILRTEGEKIPEHMIDLCAGNEANEEEDESDLQVVMAVTPMLTMTGTVAGTDYDKTTVVVQSQVFLSVEE